MSVKMVDYIVGEHHIDIDPHMLKRVEVMPLFAIVFYLFYIKCIEFQNFTS